MADIKSTRSFPDRERVSVDKDYEVEHFAKQNGITPDQVRDLVRKVGNNRFILMEAAKAVRSRQR